MSPADKRERDSIPFAANFKALSSAAFLIGHEAMVEFKVVQGNVDPSKFLFFYV